MWAGHFLLFLILSMDLALQSFHKKHLLFVLATDEGDGTSQKQAETDEMAVEDAKYT